QPQQQQQQQPQQQQSVPFFPQAQSSPPPAANETPAAGWTGSSLAAAATGNVGRWWITANTPETSDASFVWEQFQAQVNADLADVLGNFVNRIAKFAESKFGGVVPAGGEPGPLEIKLMADLDAGIADLTAQMEAIEVRKSAQALRALWVLGNEYLQAAAPWTAIKTDPDRAAVIVRTALNLVALYARLSAPFIPFAAEKISAAFGLDEPMDWPQNGSAEVLSSLPAGHTIAAPDVLFRKIEDDQLAAWAEQFGGAG
ncbi:MAG: hypothetical protein EBS42_09740, partial [Caulobacteraceae bacterium]|nr:hypothetical protein [Caulobacteraceae bacterium]